MITSIFYYPNMRKTSFHIFELSVLFGMLLVSIIFSLPGLARDLAASDEPEQMFQEAVESYRQGDHYRALIGFRGLLRDHEDHRRATAALLMQAKCYYWLHNYDQAVESLQSLLKNYPKSSYRDDAQYLLGNCYYRQGHYWRSADQLREVIEFSDVPELIDLARDGLRVLVDEALSLRQLDRLFDDLPDDAISPLILVERAEGELAAGHREEALASAEKVLRMTSRGEAAKRAIAIRDAAQDTIPERLTIGVVCPLSGPYAPFGEQLRDGVQIAVEEHNVTSGVEIIIQVRDSQGLATKATEVTRDLIDQQHVIAILGPLLSASAVGAGAVSDCRGVPLITPTAAEEEVARVGRFVFQRSVGPWTLGERMATYAVEELELPLVAVLAPQNGFGQAAVDGFNHKIHELGSDILTVAWYHPGDTDYAQQLTHIRHRKRAYEDSLRSLNLLSRVTSPIVKSDLPPEERSVHVDGMFIPASPDEAGMIAPQIEFHRLETLVLGTSGWGAREALRIGGSYMDGVHFATDFAEELSSDQYLDFSYQYKERYGADPGKVAVFSFECAALVLEGITGGAYTSEALYQFLANVEGYPGLAGDISFTRGSGANDEIMILTVQDGRVLRLE
jgi:ABC-type branched-subunit amino acid transport system substrate-binding protein